MGFDSIERFRDGLQRYLLSAQDECSRIGFALAVPSHGSLWATQALNPTQTVLPLRIEYPLHDNGSEFAGQFAKAVQAAGIPQWHTFPRTPKMNARSERFNRTLQEEFLDYHEELLFADLKAFKDKLLDWLLWYNTERPHHALGLEHPRIGCGIISSIYTVQNVLAEYTGLTANRYSRIFAPRKKLFFCSLILRYWSLAGRRISISGWRRVRGSEAGVIGQVRFVGS